MKQNFIHSYSLIGLIAIGGQAKVYQATKNNTFYAIKIYDNKDQDSDISFRNQNQIISQLEHPILLSPLQYIEGQTILLQNINPLKRNIVIMPYLKNGDLMNEVIINGRFDPRIVLKLSKQILSCLIYLHKKNIYHCDIKPQNILLDDDFNAKLIDFGLFSHKINENIKKIAKLYYIAPQIKKQMPHTQKSQAFSFGVLMFILIIGSLPFKATKHTDVSYRLLLQGKLNQFWKQFSQGSNQQIDQKIKLVIGSLLEPNPKRRWSFNDILLSQWFSQQQITQQQYIELFMRRQHRKQFINQEETGSIDIQQKSKQYSHQCEFFTYTNRECYLMTNQI